MICPILLDAIKINLHGTKFIEASAGTGKTFALIIIYLRLLLHLGKQSAFSRPLQVEEILVVTFTKATTELLRSQIRKNIHQFLFDCIRKKSNNFLFSQLLSQIKNFDLAISRLSIAINKINQASILTIHSFCQKIITQHTMELKIPFNVSIIEDATSLYQKTCNNFWRYYFYPLPLRIISLIQTFWKNPTELLKNISPYIYTEESNISLFKNIIYYNVNNIISSYDKILANIDDIKKTWFSIQNNIIEIIYSCNINRKKYNKKNLARWINIINNWTHQPTTNHIIPDVLKNFRFSIFQTYINYTDNQHIQQFNICKKIEAFYQSLLSFKTLIFHMSLNKIRENLKKNVYLTSEITYNDLIEILMVNLTNLKKNNLAYLIRKSYPIAIIDEFQDTDIQQYKIFNCLYNNNSENCLILIGDPKQSIYAFRGADIFSYMILRKTIPEKYYLNINWRSSTNMVKAINQLFQCIPNPFVFNDIPFIPFQSVNQNNMHQFLINNNPQPAIQFWLHPTSIKIDEYKYIMAQECATTINYLLQQINKNKVWLTNYTSKRLLQASDIIILVRNHDESSLMQSTLSKINISSISLSHSENIFGTQESQELLLLLQAILFPNRRAILTALTTCFFPFNIIDIENINHHKDKWGKILEKFMEYYLIWKQKGILLMIQKIIFHYEIHKKLLSTKINNKSKLINILHLGELLQNHEKKINNKNELIQWLITRIHKSKKEHISDQLLRLNDDKQLIKISTIHKSKGLEFPIVFLPFIANFNLTKNKFFHNRTSYKICLDFNELELNSNLVDEERLSEDLRLLYVAITRSIYFCGIGIAPIIYKNKKKNNISDLHHSALGYLIQKKTAGDAIFLKNQLKQLNIRSMNNISFRNIFKEKYNNDLFNSAITSNPSLSVQIWKKPKSINTLWNITSYSELIANTNNTLTFPKNLNNLENINNNLNIQEISNSFSPHTFPKGKICGEFFHNLFNSLNFQENLHTDWISNQLEKYNFDPIWAPTIQKWIYIIINTPLNNKNLTLSSIQSKNKKTELNFYLPINSYITPNILDNLRKNYDPLSFKTPPLTFSKIKGMLQGFIDLIFYWNHKYYLIDYKTNWLGINDHAYTSINMKNEIIQHHYELQYQLYTLALHRFLRHRIESYNYEKKFGGIYYLFIRGMNKKTPNHGILFFKPCIEFIDKLDNMFAKK